MGYYTRHSLKLFDSTGTKEIVENQEIIKTLIEYYELNAIDENGDAEESCKWYSHTQDMREFSKRYPDIVFELYGEGEEAGDIWKEYFKNGKSQKVRARIVLDSYDENNLI